MHKYASNVVEKCLTYGGLCDRDELISHMLGAQASAIAGLPQPQPLPLAPLGGGVAVPVTPTLGSGGGSGSGDGLEGDGGPEDPLQVRGCLLLPAAGFVVAVVVGLGRKLVSNPAASRLWLWLWLRVAQERAPGIGGGGTGRLAAGARACLRAHRELPLAWLLQCCWDIRRPGSLARTPHLSTHLPGHHTRGSRPPAGPTA